MASITQKNSSERKTKRDPQLPWWVELLFVQVGLPDKWLSKILKAKRDTKAYISENQAQIIYGSVVLIFFLSLLPVTTYYYRINKCVEWTIDNNKESTTVSDKLLLNAIANNYCNGGS